MGVPVPSLEGMSQVPSAYAPSFTALLHFLYTVTYCHLALPLSPAHPFTAAATSLAAEFIICSSCWKWESIIRGSSRGSYSKGSTKVREHLLAQSREGWDSKRQLALAAEAVGWKCYPTFQPSLFQQ